MIITSKLAPLFPLSALALMAGAAFSVSAAGCPSSPTATCGLSPYNGQDLYFDRPSGSGFLNDPTSDATIYMDTRQQNDTQSLTVSGTDMTGKYIQASQNGTAAITLNKGASTDMIEGGNSGAETTISITLDNARLLGENDSVGYRSAVGDKAYMKGATVFIDQADRGAHSVSAVNGSQLHGSIITGGAGAQSVNLDGSTLDKGSIYALSKNANSTVTLTNARLDATQSPVAGAFDSYVSATGISLPASPAALDAVALGLAGTQTNRLTLTNATVTGDAGLLNRTGTQQVAMKNSTLNGDLVLAGAGSARIEAGSSLINGSIDASANSGNSTIVISDGTTLTGDVITGSGNDSMAVIGGAEVKGSLDGGAGKNSLLLDGKSAIDGAILNISTVHATQDNTIVTPHIGSGTAYSLMNRSLLIGQTMSDARLTLSTDSMVIVTGAVTGVNSLIISEMGPQSQEGHFIVGSFNDLSRGTVNYQFANGQQQAAARSGAWNYDLLATTVPMNNATNGAEIVVVQRHSGLAHDVRGAIAGLDGAKQAGQSVSADLASRLDKLRSSFLLNGVSEGAHVWGDYLYQTGDFTDDADYHSNLQGAQIGVDWSHLLDNGDMLTGGFALAWVRNRVSDSDNQGNFNNAVYGDFYSLYGGWQQPLNDDGLSLFADGSVSAGEIRYSLRVHNLPTTTTGIKEALNGTYDGNMYDVEARTGFNVNAGAALIQPYVLLGWNEVNSDKFSSGRIDMAKNKTASWHTGGGVRVTGELEVNLAKIRVLPWLDARYVTEFNDNTSLTAADYAVTSGHNQKMGMFGAGANLAITRDLYFTSGIYTGTGDVDNSVSLQAGLSFDF
ncbi:autotransporter outer membrane beta-barrel domain-containing protein [Enterobacteriaceae bacterium]